MAFSTRGKAESRSACTFVFFAVTSVAILFASADFSSAIAFYASTFSFSPPTIIACSCASALAASTSIAVTLIVSSNSVTIAVVSFSFTTPFSYFSSYLSRAPCFYPSIPLKSLINSKNDFGVV